MAAVSQLHSGGAAASLYRQLGWSIVPADADTKRALGLWKPYAKKAADLATMESWCRRYPRAGIAVITGAVSGVVVLDCDGETGLKEALAQGIPRTPCVRTPSGGMHFYFQHPGFSVHNAAKLGTSKKIDVRGEVGYVLAPHTKRSDGRRYTWAISPLEARAASPPAWFSRILERLAVGAAPHRETLSSSPTGVQVNDDELDALLQQLPERVQMLIVDGCDSTFPSRSECDYFVVNQLVASGLSDDQIEAIYDSYAVGEKYREPGQGPRYLGLILDKARSKYRIVQIRYADLQTYDRGARVHLALVTEEGQMIRCGVTVPSSSDASLSVRWAALFDAAGLPVPIGKIGAGRVRMLEGKRIRVQLDSSRDNPVVSFHRF